MLISESRKASNNHLTPKIREEYSDLTLLSTDDKKTLGYLVFQAKSKANNQIHQIRALNLGSEFAQQNINTAITLFLQEAFRLHTLHSKCIILDTIEFHDNKVCYAIEPMISQVAPSPNVNLAKLLKDLITDLDHLDSKGAEEICLSAARIYQIPRKRRKNEQETQSQLSYFIQDWNKVFAEDVAVNKNMMQAQSLLDMKGAIEKENIYNLACSVLELHGLDKHEIKNLLVNSPTFYDEALKKVVLENSQLESKVFTVQMKNILLLMLAKDPNQRPNAKDLWKMLEVLSKDDEEEGLIKKLDEKVKLQINKVNSVIEENKQPESGEQGDVIDAEEGKSIDREDEKSLNPLKFDLKSLNNRVKELLVKDPSTVTDIDLENRGLLAFFTKVGVNGAKAIGTNETWLYLRSLNLANNGIGDDGAVALGGNKSWSSLLYLNLAWNSIGPKGAEALSSNSTWTELTTLMVQGNSLRAEGATALGRNKSWKNLNWLNVAHNELRILGVAGLSSNASWVNLIELDLSTNNSNGDESVSALCSNKSWSKLSRLRLSAGFIPEQVRAIKKRWPDIKLDFTII